MASALQLAEELAHLDALFQEAARQDRLTVEKALEVAAYLREARHEPDRPFMPQATEAP